MAEQEIAKPQPLSVPAAEVELPVDEAEEGKLALLSHRQLVFLRFRKNRLAVLGLCVITCLYVMVAFAEFVAPYDPNRRFQGYVYAPPSKIRLQAEDGSWHWPFTYPVKRKTDTITFERKFLEDTSTRYTIRLFVRGDSYKLWGLIRTDLHLFGAPGYDGPLTLFGLDYMGRDLFSRVIYGSRISLSVGLVGVLMSLVIGLILGGLSGLYGGVADNIIQRVIELIRSIPTIPLWMGLAAALPPSWPQLRIYFAITIILSFVGWTTLARVVRGKFLSLREEDFVLAARQSGASEWFIIWQHLVPSFMSYILVHLTLAIPGMILGETSLSFLGLGLAPPTISWGVLLKDAQKLQEVALHPWILIPALFVLAAVLSFNFLGDGLRDAVDPYGQRV